MYKETNANRNSNIKRILPKRRMNEIELEAMLISLDENGVGTSELKKKKARWVDEIFKYYFSKLFNKTQSTSLFQFLLLKVHQYLSG